MNLPSHYYPQMEMKYREMLDQQKTIADKANNQLLRINPEVVQTEAGKQNLQGEFKEIMFYTIFKYFDDAVFFQTEETLNKLKFLNVSPSVIRWFTPLSKIHEQLDLLRKEGIQVDSLFAFTCIKSYLKSKFSVDIFLQYKTVSHDSVRMSILSKELIKLRARKRLYGPNLQTCKDPLAFHLNHCLIELRKGLDSFNNNKQAYNTDILFEFSRGKTEFFYLQKLLDECFDYDENSITKTKFLSMAYDLISLLIQDRIFIDDAEFFSSRKRIYQSYKSYDAYKAKKNKVAYLSQKKIEVNFIRFTVSSYISLIAKLQ